MAKEINPFLMFANGAEAAMNFYLSLFAGSQIESLARYDATDVTRLLANPGIRDEWRAAFTNGSGTLARDVTPFATWVVQQADEVAAAAEEASAGDEPREARDD